MAKRLTDEEKQLRAWKDEGFNLVFKCKRCGKIYEYKDISSYNQIDCGCRTTLLLNEDRAINRKTTVNDLFKKNILILYEG